MNLSPEDKMRAYYESVGLPFPEVKEDEEDMTSNQPRSRKPLRGPRILLNVLVVLAVIVGLLIALVGVLALLMGGDPGTAAWGITQGVVLIVLPLVLRWLVRPRPYSGR